MIQQFVTFIENHMSFKKFMIFHAKSFVLVGTRRKLLTDNINLSPFKRMPSVLQLSSKFIILYLVHANLNISSGYLNKKKTSPY